MTQPSQLDKTYFFILKRMVETGQAPFYTEIAAELGVSVEEGRKALHDLFGAAIAVWLFPKTDYIAPFPPFSNLPTQYRITIEASRNGLASEGLSRWRSAGFLKERQCGSTLRAPIADRLSGWR